MNKVQIFVFCLLLLCLSFLHATVGRVVPTANLVAHYPFSGNANDASGNEHNGTVYGATLSADRFGNPEGAFHFNSGEQDYIRIPDHPQLRITTNLSISIWMKHAATATNYEDIVMKGNDTYGFQFNNSSDHVLFHIKAGNSSWRNLNSNFIPVQDQWFNVVGTYDGSTQRVYINGVQTNSLNWTGSIASNTDPLDFGYKVAGDNTWYNGDLDDLRIYDRVLTPAEVMQLYEESSNYLSAPLEVNIQYASGNVTVSWQGVSGANSYRVYSSALPDEGFSLDESGSFAGNSWTALANVPRRFYLVRAVAE
jgi:hypothetical protein